MSVDDIYATFSYGASQPPRGAYVELGRRCAVDDVDAHFASTMGQWLTGARRDDRRVSAPRQLRGQPQRLTLTAAPSAFGVYVKDSEGHRAQLPWLCHGAQVAVA